MKNLELKSLKNRYSSIHILLFTLIGVVPFVSAFIYALLYSLGVIGVMNNGFTLEFWSSVFDSSEFIKSFVFSIAVSGVSVFISIGLALWFALKLEKELNKPLLSFIIYLPLAVPGIVSAFFTFQLFSKSGFYSRVSHYFGWISEVRQFPGLVNDPYAIGIILTFITVVLPFFILLFLNVYKNERIKDLELLSKALGASKNQTIWKVSLPILLKKTWTLIGLYFILLLGAYEIPLILGRESPQMLSVLVIREIKQFDLTQISEGYVAAIVYTLVVLVAAILLFSKQKRMAHEF